MFKQSPDHSFTLFNPPTHQVSVSNQVLHIVSTSVSPISPPCPRTIEPSTGSCFGLTPGLTKKARLKSWRDSSLPHENNFFDGSARTRSVMNSKSTDSNSTTGNKLVVNYQISTNTNSTNSNTNIGSKLVVNFQIFANNKSLESSSIICSKLVVNYQISTNIRQLIIIPVLLINWQ